MSSLVKIHSDVTARVMQLRGVRVLLVKGPNREESHFDMRPDEDIRSALGRHYGRASRSIEAGSKAVRDRLFSALQNVS